MIVAHIRERALDRSGGGHRRAHEVGTSAAALAAFEVAVRRAGAALAGGQLVGVHPQAHRAAGIAPFEDEALVAKSNQPSERLVGIMHEFMKLETHETAHAEVSLLARYASFEAHSTGDSLPTDCLSEAIRLNCVSCVLMFASYGFDYDAYLALYSSTSPMIRQCLLDIQPMRPLQVLPLFSFHLCSSAHNSFHFRLPIVPYCCRLLCSEALLTASMIFYCVVLILQLSICLCLLTCSLAIRISLHMSMRLLLARCSGLFV